MIETNKPSIYDIKDDNRLVAITENKNRAPEEKLIQLTELPWVSIQGEGQFSGQHFCFVRVSYCPLSCKFCDIKTSWTDKGKVARSIEEIAEWCRKRFPRRVCITGGEPFFKYDEEVKYLTEALHKRGKLVHFETSGISLPTIVEQYAAWDKVPEIQLPDWVCISPKFRDCVPKSEMFGYIKTLVDRLKIWKIFLEMRGNDSPSRNDGPPIGEFKFVIGAEDPDTDICYVVNLMQEVFDEEEDYSGWKLVFQPECRKEMYEIPFDKPRKDELYIQYLNDLRKVTDAVGRYALNFPGADIAILPQLHQLVCHQ